MNPRREHDRRDWPRAGGGESKSITRVGGSSFRSSLVRAYLSSPSFAFWFRFFIPLSMLRWQLLRVLYINMAIMSFLRIILLVFIAFTSSLLLHDQYIDHFVVLPPHRFLFCLIDKNANSGFSALFKAADMERKQSIPLKKGRHPQDTYLWHNPKVYNLSLSTLDKYIVDPSWTKVVFYRDPLSRFLSAFLSKCEHRDTNDPKPICLNTFGQAYASFHLAVSHLYRSHSLPDAHFAPQSQLCGGLTQSLSHYQGVYELNPLTSRELIIKILKKIRVPITGGVAQTLRKLFPKVDKVEHFKVEPTKNILGSLTISWFGATSFRFLV